MQETIAASRQNRHSPDENPPYSPAAEFNGETDEPAEGEGFEPSVPCKRHLL
jgi:hypothetical protein